ncbi:DUF4424 domain-containing protein [Buttiauxella sp. A2-C2_NF]|uniref:DUF4424 family protein n=1 Tax=Buttiauxella ferragutiae TaxID=82989 RepID=UPI001E42D5BD|nr:DUF4424 family protein [Buttiauxella ferragutiae]MCE0826483.1 DUF4424 domain-containing protein [Buttiauxella ferragutiae]
MPRLIIMLTLLLATSANVFANDSAFGDINGSIQLLKQNDISMAKERLLIGTDRINVDYVFINHSTQDITVPVSFPMPRVVLFEPSDHSAGILNFKLSVDGKPVATESRWVVTLIDEKGNIKEDITEKVTQAGWSVEDLIKVFNTDSPVDSLPEELPPLPAQWVKDGMPQFTIQQHFVWQQRFPAQKEVVIHHSYTPSLSGGVPTTLGWILGDGTKDNPGNECLTDASRKQVQQLNKHSQKGEEEGQISWQELQYVLTTGANWKDSVIGDFTLRIHKDAPQDVVVPCFKYPLTQIDDTTFEFHQKDFKPAQDLEMTFYSELSW